MPYPGSGLPLSRDATYCVVEGKGRSFGCKGASAYLELAGTRVRARLGARHEELFGAESDHAGASADWCNELDAAAFQRLTVGKHVGIGEDTSLPSTSHEES
eukprot:3138635-Rhodomonas_salina.3